MEELTTKQKLEWLFTHGGSCTGAAFGCEGCPIDHLTNPECFDHTALFHAKNMMVEMEKIEIWKNLKSE